MPRVCTICRHDDRQKIEEAVLALRPYRNIAEKYGLSMPAISRHTNAHLPDHLRRAHEAEQASNAADLLQTSHELDREARDRYEIAEDKSTKLDWFKVMQAQLGLRMKLRGIGERAVAGGTTNVYNVAAVTGAGVGPEDRISDREAAQVAEGIRDLLDGARRAHEEERAFQMAAGTNGGDPSGNGEGFALEGEATRPLNGPPSLPDPGQYEP